MAQGVLLIVMLLFVATLSAIFFKKIRFPYTIGLVIVGMILSYVCDKINLDVSDIKLTPELILYILLPALIFEAAVNLDIRSLLKNLVPTLVLAAPGLVIATFITGAAVYFLTPLSLSGAMLFGALISATDPVAVISLFKELGAPKRLTMLVDAESLFNDATAIVMFNIVKKIAWAAAGTGVAMSMSTCLDGAKDFVIVFFVGLLIGMVIGYIMTLIISKAGNEPLVQISLSTIVAYTAFIVSDKLEYSGVMSVVGAGIVMSYYGKTNMTVDIKEYLLKFWEFAAFIANSFIFLLLGFTEELMLIKPDNSGSWFIYILWAILAVIVARAVVVFGLCPIIGKIRKADKVDWRYQLVMFWGGLRGAVPMALVLSLPHDFENRDLLVALTLGIVLFTLLIQGTTVKKMLTLLKLDRPDSFTVGSTALAKLMSHERGLKCLENVATEGKFPEPIVDELRKSYNAKIKEERKSLDTRRKSKDFKDHSLKKNLWIGSISIMQSAYNHLYDHRMLSSTTYREFLSITERHADIVISTGHLPESIRFEGLGFKMEKLFFKLAHSMFHTGRIPRRLLIRTLTHDQEKSFALFFASERVLSMLKEGEELYKEDMETFNDCKKYYTDLYNISSKHLDKLKERHSKELEFVTREILQRVIYDAELEELETLMNNGVIPEAVAENLKSGVENKMELSKKKVS